MSQSIRSPWAGHEAPGIRRALAGRDGLQCARCGGPLPDDFSGVDIGHAPGHERAFQHGKQRTDLTVLQLEHAHCNRSAGSKLGHALRQAGQLDDKPPPSLRAQSRRSGRRRPRPGRDF